MLDTVIKFLPGQSVHGFTILSYKDRDSKNCPVYEVRHTCGSITTMLHRRPYATKCTHCELQATRSALAKPPNITAKLEAVKAYDQSVERLYEQSKKEPASVSTPAPIQPPQPSKTLSALARRAIADGLNRGWTMQECLDAGLGNL